MFSKLSLSKSVIHRFTVSHFNMSWICLPLDFLLSTQSKCADLNKRLQVSENECESLRQQLADSNLVKQDYQQVVR